MKFEFFCLCLSVYKDVWVYLSVGELETTVINATGVFLFVLVNVINLPVYYSEGNVSFLSLPPSPLL